MPKSRSRRLQEHSLQMALAAIEIYNKPTFPARDLVFPILMVNAWESLAKARLLSLNTNRLNCLWVRQGRIYKRKANGDYMTIGALKAVENCNIPAPVYANIKHLVDIRDAATHLPTVTSGLKTLNYNLGTASLGNYSILTNEWFGITLGNLGLMVLPLAFSYPFERIKSIALEKEPESIARIVKAVRSAHELVPEGSNHQVICEITSELVSVKKSDDHDIVLGISPESELQIYNQRQSVLQRYPHRHKDVLRKVKESCTGFTQNDLNRIIKQHRIKGNEAYSSYTYLSLELQRQGPKQYTTCIYNQDFVKFCISLVQQGSTAM